MKIITFDINKILVERKQNILKNLEIKTNLIIEDIKEDFIETFDSKQPVLKFDFLFSIDYAPSIAKIEIRGTTITITEKDDKDSILKDWKNKKFQAELKLPLFNFIMKKCNLKAIELEDELNLPLHIPFPKLSASIDLDASKNKDAVKEKKPANYTG